MKRFCARRSRSSLPHFNPADDLAEGEPPPSVGACRSELAATDAILFSTPEYAGRPPWAAGELARLDRGRRRNPTGGTSAHDSLQTILGYTGSQIVEDACRRAPVARSDVGSDGLIADQGCVWRSLPRWRRSRHARGCPQISPGPTSHHPSSRGGAGHEWELNRSSAQACERGGRCDAQLIES